VIEICTIPERNDQQPGGVRKEFSKEMSGYWKTSRQFSGRKEGQDIS